MEEENGVIALVGVFVTVDGEFWLLNRKDDWQCPLLPGYWFEVWTGSSWQLATMQYGEYQGRYLRFADGHCARPAICMRGRLVL